jgi:predicted lipase
LSNLSVLVKNYKVNKILLTGHSLGAALASINAIYLAMSSEYGSIPIEVYNFGSPRFANGNLAQYVNLKVPHHYRMVHNRDIVPHLPPQI